MSSWEYSRKLYTFSSYSWMCWEKCEHLLLTLHELFRRVWHYSPCSGGCDTLFLFRRVWHFSPCSGGRDTTLPVQEGVTLLSLFKSSMALEFWFNWSFSNSTKSSKRLGQASVSSYCERSFPTLWTKLRNMNQVSRGIPRTLKYV